MPFYIPVTIMCLFGNILVCIIIFRNPRMRTRCFYILMNLAVADMGFALATPLQLLQFANVNPGTAGCKLSIFVIDIFFGAAVLSLAAVSIDRYHGICFNRMTRKEGGRLGNRLIGLIWLGAALIYTPMLVACRKNPNPHELTCDCHSIWPEKYHYVIYACFVVFCTYLLPLVVMVFCYSNILWTIQKSKHEAPALRSGKDNRRNVIKMLIAATVLFMLSWLLYNMLYLLKKFDAISENLLGKLWLFSQVLGFANSACNPFVYCIFSKNFRQGFKDVILCRGKSSSYARRMPKEGTPVSQERFVKSRSNTAKSNLETGYNSSEDTKNIHSINVPSSLESGYLSNVGTSKNR
uniref:Neuropeptide-like GPCR n=1 Tax=Tripedalia cystophora TaxID=6141 RepID=A0A481ZLL4_TRICY|nr:neuropeptide-like GPCR [Tripedalia cystophora]